MQTLLTLADVAANLECSEVQVQRLISLQALHGSQVKDGSVRSFRITQGQLDAYIQAGSPRFALPVGARHLTNSDRWFDDRHIAFLGRLYDQAVTERLYSLLPEPVDGNLPAGVRVSSQAGQFQRVQVDVPEADVSDLLTAPPPYKTRFLPVQGRIDGLPDFQGQWRDAFLLSRLWNSLALVVMNAEGLHEIPPIRKLYREPAVFQGYVDKAWQTLSNARLLATRRYTVPTAGGTYQNAGGNVISASASVQTIEVDLVLSVERIAQGRKAAIVQREL